jgi:hypothetical protein
MLDKKTLISGVNSALYTNPDECTKVDIVKNFIFAVKKALSTDAVAIRLFEGDDFPFYTTLGFSNTFVEAEKYLCPYHLKGKKREDWDKGDCLDCACGAVAEGKLKIPMGEVTDHGSFWTADAKDEAKTLTPEQIHGLRGKCLDSGYESIFISQIKWGDKIIGVLQVNDRRKGLFIKDDILLLESLGSC